MRRVELDFWNPGLLLKGISQVYKVSETSIIQLMTEFGDQQDFLSAFFERYNIYPDVHSLDGVFVKCKLIGKYPDKKLLETMGLMSLKELLKREESFLVRFLKGEGIHIDIDKLTFQLHEKVIKIDSTSNLGNKLCHDNGEIEAFYYAASENDMIDYSVVKQYPEILYTIDSFVRKNFGEHSCLGNKWSELVTGFDTISFYVNLNDITYINGYSEEWREVLPYEEFYKGIYPDTDSYPKLLYMNLWLLNIGMECLCGELYSEFCLGIRNDVVIPYKELQITHYEK